ncbi:DUF2515 family protein [Paenibacillus protaetiae]|uniref:DUF2515 domain-containing protein n=1 Tax=Paenibacillus protaetiae TaxID=2509456 RepID=A0A4P6ER86_9BACL|nr:DUF2515 family protein [Paenibacillus protaetiae]QAY65540.1 DUF2515 domain-containing protein [Paenibacillus protaetiae]
MASSKRWKFKSLAAGLIRMPVSLYDMIAAKWLSWRDSRHFTLTVAELTPEASGQMTAHVQADYAMNRRQNGRLQMEAALPLGELEKPASRHRDVWLAKLSCDDREQIERVRAETRLRNRNNVTRTEAYRRLYLRRPELHWALLAHMVSRNAGWNMTDLKGEWLPRLIREADRNLLFQLLERCNSYIFHDAYVQLRLYEYSLAAGRSFMYLLPELGVSRWMVPVWEQFWETRNPVPLTVALIINEQHFIEQRVIQKPFFQEQVLPAFITNLQALLLFNTVLLPYGREQELRLAGLSIERFERIEKRIEFGKSLYALLYGAPSIKNGVIDFVQRTAHTGSRADYAPLLYQAGLPSLTEPAAPYQKRLHGGNIEPGKPLLLSPVLEEAWSDRALSYPETGDWYQSALDVEPYVHKMPLPHLFEKTREHLFLMNKMELAVLAKERMNGSGR